MMDDLVISKSVEWIRGNIDRRMSKREIAEKARASDLPPDAKVAFEELPDGDYTQKEVLARVQDDLVTRLGQANMTMRGFGGSS